MLMLRGLHGIGPLGALGIPPCSSMVDASGYGGSYPQPGINCVDDSPGTGSATPTDPCAYPFTMTSSGCACAPGTTYVPFYQSCVDSCAVGQSYNAQGICTSNGQPSGGSSAGSGSAGNSALETALASMGTAIGLKLVGGSTPTAKPGAVVPTPWYMTPIGLLVIVGGVVGAVMLTRNSPAKAA